MVTLLLKVRIEGLKDWAPAEAWTCASSLLSVVNMFDCFWCFKLNFYSRKLTQVATHALQVIRNSHKNVWKLDHELVLFFLLYSLVDSLDSFFIKQNIVSGREGKLQTILKLQLDVFCSFNFFRVQ